MQKYNHNLSLSVLTIFLGACAHNTSNRPILLGEFGNPDHTLHEAHSKQYMVASQGEATSLAAREMFELGGNIIDAAVAASFTIAVERPQSTGIGGGGFMLIHWADTGNVLALDFREKAPIKAKETMFQDPKGEVIPNLSSQGILASAVPGMVAGTLTIHDKYGKLSRQQILAPAIRLAEEGVRVYPHLAKAIDVNKELLKKFPASKALFLKPDGEPYQEGELLKQKDLAKTLRTIAEQGKDGFYKGWVAQAILDQQKTLGGLITAQDLDNYEVKFREPVKSTYKGYDIYSMPPPSSGGIHVIEILNILENDNLGQFRPYEAQNIHRTAAAMQLAFADRAKYLGDVDFVNVPISGLIDKSYAKTLRKTIVAHQAKGEKEVKTTDPFKYESKETTHFTIADAQGNVVSSTQTINGWLGSGVVVPQAGFVMNNQMDDFSARPGVPNKLGVIGGKENAIAPQKRPLSSMSPTIVTKAGKPVLALGSPSGPQIITCVTLTVLNYIEYKIPLYESVSALRYHHQWLPNELIVEDPGLPKETTTELEKMGYNVSRKGIGCKVQAVAFEGDQLHGVSDPREEGLAIGENLGQKRQNKRANAPVRAD